MRASAAFAFALPILAAATAIPRDGSCNTGSITCCNQVQSSTSTGIAQLAGLLGIDLGSITGLVGSRSPSLVLAATLALLSLFAAPTTASAASSPSAAAPSTSTFEQCQKSDIVNLPGPLKYSDLVVI
ncbi:hypothetical protein GALMADRAFT_140194 [Galerina marginata CBS 339.88]|uniref:Hydrophobin n=1 Tax=Galerina marginata (strain CBS 339.88) TaxID=685588 RepID=A0A067T101_GALM3|nr:hypothetical protein GALMADRAFT_140194 [Galerina marginata CBS 339.88]